MTEQEQLAEIKALVQDTNQRMGHLEGRFNDLEGRFGHLEKKVDHLEKETTEINQRLKEFDIRIDTYQKASQQIVNLAFGLLTVTAASIVIPAIFNR